MELEISEKETQIKTLRTKLDSITEELNSLKLRYQKSESEIAQLQQENQRLSLELQNFNDQKRELEQLNDEWENSNRILEHSKQDLEERLYQAQENAILYKEELDEVCNLRETEVQRLKEECKELKHELQLLKAQNPESEQVQELQTQLEKAHRNKTQLKASAYMPSGKNWVPEGSYCDLEVVVKVRPSLPNESKSALKVQGNTLHLGKPYEYKKVVSCDSRSQELFLELKPSLDTLASGSKVSVLAFGSKGSGKTYTLLDVIFQSVSYLESFTFEFQVHLSCIETCKDGGKDLLTMRTFTKDSSQILKCSQKKLGKHWTREAKQLIKLCSQKRRKNALKGSNFLVSFELTGKSFKSTINFVELAKPERSGRATYLKETVNKSSLEKIIYTLENSTNSLLTRILKGTEKVFVILNCSSSLESLEETTQTLGLGSQLRTLERTSSMRKSFKTSEVGRTLSLLENERAQKNHALTQVEKLQAKVQKLKDFFEQKENLYTQEVEKLRKEIKLYRNREKHMFKKFKENRVSSPKPPKIPSACFNLRSLTPSRIPNPSR